MYFSYKKRKLKIKNSMRKNSINYDGLNFFSNIFYNKIFFPCTCTQKDYSTYSNSTKRKLKLKIRILSILNILQV